MKHVNTKYKIANNLLGIKEVYRDVERPMQLKVPPPSMIFQNFGVPKAHILT